MDVYEAMRRRRTVRRFRRDPVPDDAVQRILEAGRLAPSGGNLQNWVFGVVRDPGQIRTLAAAAGEQDWIASAPMLMALCTNIGPEVRSDPADELASALDRIRLGEALLRHLADFPDPRRVQSLVGEGNVLLPGAHMVLAAAAEGLAASWIGFMDLREISDQLRLPDELICEFMLAIGYPDETPDPLERRPLAEIVFEDRWPFDREPPEL